MNTYTYQIRGEPDGDAKPAYSEEILADSLGEAVDKAKAITRLRPAHDNETIASLLRGEAAEPVWSQPVEKIRAGEDRLVATGGSGIA